MWEYVIFAIGFFVITLIIQGIEYKLIDPKSIWNNFRFTGKEAIICIAVIGLVQKDLTYLASIIGFVTADEAGKSLGWH